MSNKTHQKIKDLLDTLIARCEADDRNDIAALLCCAGVSIDNDDLCEALIGAVTPIMLRAMAEAFLDKTVRNN